MKISDCLVVTLLLNSSLSLAESEGAKTLESRNIGSNITREVKQDDQIYIVKLFSEKTHISIKAAMTIFYMTEIEYCKKSGKIPQILGSEIVESNSWQEYFKCTKTGDVKIWKEKEDKYCSNLTYDYEKYLCSLLKAAGIK
jgi:hypothetical protein